MQKGTYTGYKDCNGNMICDGDKIRVNAEMKSYTASVFKEDNEWCIDAPVDLDDDWIKLNELILSGVEIIS